MFDISKYKKPNDVEIEQAMNNAVTQVETDLENFTHKFKINGTTDNFYEPNDNISWTSGFWTGQIWMAYEITGDEKYRKAAEIQVDSFLHRIENKIEINNHDMGFLYSLSCVAAYKLTGNENAKKAAILAADNLITRYREDGKFIQAWGNVGADDNYRLIIDCLLNLPLLYWTSDVTGDDKYAKIAKQHIDTSLKVIMRDDCSTYHTFYFEQGTGKPLYGETRQGYSNDSSWSRGQAWGVYGTALSYMYTKNPEYIEKFYKITDFFIDNLPKDLVPYWDFKFTDGSDEPKDSSAAAIAVCGMLEMSKYLDEDKSNYYKDIALKILKSLIDNYAVSDSKISNGQLLHGVYARKSPYNPCRNRNVDECNTWGDYYYMEALIRLIRDWELYW
ncbi:glycoside hydrolase family 88 protein [Vallitalea guaymasensis]|uniref:glycoside hydrolase family 88 protein n=1 Tax=Vallitalea guaymasensis TaxID=1185412 RepID=UPI002354F94D|nr:glycoside hydrolase family 88 protein [Vallitalea guaymasensis]